MFTETSVISCFNLCLFSHFKCSCKKHKISCSVPYCKHLMFLFVSHHRGPSVYCAQARDVNRATSCLGDISYLLPPFPLVKNLLKPQLQDAQTVPQSERTTDGKQVSTAAEPLTDYLLNWRLRRSSPRGVPFPTSLKPLTKGLVTPWWARRRSCSH